MSPVLPEPAAGTAVGVLGRLRGAVFGIDAEKVLARGEGRGWHVDDDRTRDQLYSVWRSVAYGYNAAVREPQLARLTTRIEGVDPAFRGWAWEGAGMGLTLLDRLMPPPRRARAAMRGPAALYSGAFSIGVGWTLAMLRQVPRRPPAWLDPLHGWMVYDGVGFHAGLFKTKRVVEAQREPRRLTGPRALIFDHGLGRSFWWMCGADPDRIRETIEAFPKARQRQLWTGLALGATYAGGVTVDELESLRDAAAEHRPHMAASAAIAAQHRELGGNETAYTELACAVFCELTASEAARKADQARAELTVRAGECNYLVWRERISESFAA